MESILDIENAGITLKKINMYCSEEIKEIGLLASNFDRICSCNKIASFDNLKNTQDRLISKLNLIRKNNESFSMILSKNIVKYRDTSKKVYNIFDKLG